MSRKCSPPKLIFPTVAWITVGLVLPLITILIASFLTRGTYGQIEYRFTLDNYLRVFDPLLLPPILRSSLFAILNTAICLLVSVPLAFFVTSRPKKLRRIFLFLVVLPFWSSFLVRVFAWITILRSGGVLSEFMLDLGFVGESVELLYTWKAVLIGLVYVYIPFMVLPVYASVEKLDLRVVRASLDLGANSWQAFRFVVWPLIRPGVRSGVLFVSVMSFGDFVVADLLGGSRHSMVGNVIKDQFLSARNWPFGAALSVIVVVFAVLSLKVFLDLFLPLRNMGADK